MRAADWFEFCATEYRRSADRSEILFTRYGFIATIAIALGAATYKIVVDTAVEFQSDSLLHLVVIVASAGVCVHLFLSIVYLSMSLFVTGNFLDISTTHEFQEFSDRYEADMRADHSPDDEVLAAWKEATLREGLLKAMQEAERANQRVANERLKWAKWAMAQLSIASLLVLIAALARVVVEFQINI